VYVYAVAREGVRWNRMAQDGGKSARPCEHGTEPSGSIKFEEIIDSLRTSWVFKKGFTQCRL
jgi:hypothetical protein